MHTWTVLLLAAWLCQAGVGRSPNSHWAIVSKAQQLVESGRYPEANRLMEQIWSAARRAGPLDPSFVAAAEASAQFYAGEGYILKAQAVWTAALADAAKLGPSHPIHRQLLEQSAWLCQTERNAVKAAAIWKQLLDTVAEDDPLNRVRYVQALAGQKETMGLIEEAEALFLETERLQRIVRQRPPQGIGVSRIQFHGPSPMAGFLQRRGRSEEAEKLYRQDIERLQQSEDPMVLEDTLRSYSDFLRSERRFDEAGAVLQQLIDRQAASGDPNGRDRFLSTQLAHLAREAGRPADAIRLLDEAAAEAARLTGAGSPPHQAFLSDLLSMKIETNSLDGAEELARGILRDAGPSPDANPYYPKLNVLRQLLNLYQQQKRPDDAARVREQIRDLERQAQGANASTSVDSLVQSMDAALQSKEVDAALALARQALELAAGRHRRGGHEVAAVASAAMQIAFAGRRDQAIALFRQCQAALDRTLPPDHPSLGSQLLQFSYTAGGLDLRDDAAGLLARAEAILTAATGPDDSTVLNIRRNQIEAMQSRGEFANAIEKAQSLVASHEATQGPGSDAAISSLQLLFDLYAGEGDWAGAGRVAGDLLARSARLRGPRNPAHGWLLLWVAQAFARSPEPQKGLALADQAIRVIEQRRAFPGELEAAKKTRASMLAQMEQASPNRWFDVESTR